MGVGPPIPSQPYGICILQGLQDRWLPSSRATRPRAPHGDVPQALASRRPLLQPRAAAHPCKAAPEVLHGAPSGGDLGPIRLCCGARHHTLPCHAPLLRAAQGASLGRIRLAPRPFRRRPPRRRFSAACSDRCGWPCHVGGPAVCGAGSCGGARGSPLRALALGYMLLQHAHSPLQRRCVHLRTERKQAYYTMTLAGQNSSSFCDLHVAFKVANSISDVHAFSMLLGAATTPAGTALCRPSNAVSCSA